ncbi:hypothetical protein CEXT_55991 [Caerostris extrusa]|uniref:CCHC-type domain-containing protein n=1 Tax=Caerostris extrusa TaxID=172846 RepID=A0AAV4MA89_CAEEX|nr:hypothetical protein CEXT_55991 [Caerostris extrusa]
MQDGRESASENTSTPLCFKCGKFGHVSKACKQEKEICTNCGNLDHSSNNGRNNKLDDAFIYDYAVKIRECINLREAAEEASKKFTNETSNPAFYTSLEALGEAKRTLEAVLASFPGLTMLNSPKNLTDVDAAVFREFYKRNEIIL